MGMTQFPTEIDPKLAEALAEPSAPAAERLGPLEWVHKRLFNNWYNSLITVVLATISALLAYNAARFVFDSAQWWPVRNFLQEFMIGPRFQSGQLSSERWRLVAQFVIVGGAVGLALGNIGATRRDQAREAGLEPVRTPLRTYFASFWAAGLFVAVLLIAFTSTVGPSLVAGGTIAAAVAGWAITAFLPRSLRSLGWTLAALAAVIQFQMLSGTGGLAWIYTTAALYPAVASAISWLAEALQSRRPQPPGKAVSIVAWLAIAVGIGLGAIESLSGDRGFGLFAVVLGVVALVAQVTGNATDTWRYLAMIFIGLGVFQVYDIIGLSGIDWEEWGGLHLNLVAVTVAVIVAFPLGMLLALARRSNLQGLRTIAIAYIEFFRGVPLITLLLVGQFFLGFFINTADPLSLITRAIAALTLFASAYIAEIIRGGLQSVPPGQIEAGIASGLPRFTVMRLIVLPQALRAVIPPMVGQFISLFMDTTLFNIININDFLGVRELFHNQPEGRGVARAETLVFVAFGFWALAYTLSRESQRLERRLGIGQR